MDMKTSRSVVVAVTATMTEDGAVTAKVTAHAEYHPAHGAAPAMTTSTDVTLGELKDGRDLAAALKGPMQKALESALPLLSKRIDRAVLTSQTNATLRGEIAP